jgi:hypothetical protein
MKRLFSISLAVALIQSILAGCNAQPKDESEQAATEVSHTASGNQEEAYKEHTDYDVYGRIRVVDKIGFSQPQEAFSILIPGGWQQEAEIEWNMPGTACSGTFSWLKATSADGKYQLTMLPDLVYIWNTNQEVRQYNQAFDKASNCSYHQPIDAENYLRHVFGPEIGNPQIIKVETNQEVVNQMRQSGNASVAELRQYGAGEVNFTPTALNATVKWSDGREGLVVLGAMVTEIVVPNVYNGSYDKLYTTSITKRTVFKYPVAESESAKNQFAVIMSSVRTNPYWTDAVNKFWKSARQQSNVVHLGRIKAMDEQTRKIGEQAINAGNERSKAMDLDMRSWEMQQNSQDKMHTNFIKTIREVENFQDASGKYEMSSSYSNAWSRGDGNSFVMSNNPNFDPGFVFQDQQWTEMKKVD